MKPAKIALLILLDQLLTVWIIAQQPGWVNQYTATLYWPGPFWWRFGLGILVLLWLERYFKRQKHSTAFLLLWAGILTNALTVLFYGHPVDYLPFPWWYTNLADLWIVVGLVLLFVNSKKKLSNRGDRSQK